MSNKTDGKDSWKQKTRNILCKGKFFQKRNP